MAYKLGLDLGTTASAAAINIDGDVSMCTVTHQDLVIPSVVHLGTDATVLVGEAAERRARTDPAGVAREFKRRFGDPLPLILNGSPVAANDLMLALATHLVNEVSAQRGEGPQEIAVSHPANWGDYKVALLSDTIANSSLPKHTLITEPEAAAIHGATQERIIPGSVIAVYDLGGGTFDVALLRKLVDGWEQVGRPGGIERLGGIDFDTAVFHHVIESLNIDLTKFDDTDAAAITAMTRLREECREAKHALSSDTDVTIPVLLPGIHESVRLTRAEFEALIAPALNRTLEVFDTTVAASPVDVGDIDRVLLVGGSCRIPLVHQTVKNHTKRPVDGNRHPKHTVALGAAASLSAESEAREVPPMPPPTPAAGAPPRVRDMYKLPHISEAPLPDFLHKRKPLENVPPVMSVPPAERVAPTAKPNAPSTKRPTPSTESPPPTAAAATPSAAADPHAERTTNQAAVSPPPQTPSYQPTPTTPSTRTRRPAGQNKTGNKGRAGFIVAVCLLLVLLGGAVYALLDSRKADDVVVAPPTTLPTPETTAQTPETTQAPTTTTTEAVDLDPLGQPCRLSDRPDPAIRYRVSEIPDDEVRQTLNGRNVPSIGTVSGIESRPITEFPEFSELDLTYEHCLVDSRGRAWWGVHFGSTVVWSSTLFIEPAP